MNTTAPVIVYIDDQSQNLALFEATCPDDWKVYTFNAPVNVIETLANERITPWVVLSDQRMPGKSGFEILEQIIERYPHTARIIVTAHSDETAIIESVRKAKVYDYIKKPWDPDALEASIRKGMAHYQLLAERAQLLEDLQSYQLKTRKLAACAEHAPTLFMSINTQGQITYINPFGLQELASAGLSKDTAAMLLPLPVEQLVEECINQEKSIPGLENQYGDRTYLWVFSPVCGQSLLHCYALNITELVQARAHANQVEVDLKAAEHVAKHKSLFLATMSHELRSPLNAIIGYSSLILDEGSTMLDQSNGIDTVRDYISRVVHDQASILRSAEHQLMLINDILDMASVEAGKLSLNLEPVSINEIAQTIIDLVEPLAAKRSNRIHPGLTALNDLVYGDGTRLKQILLNLISNALKFTQQGVVTVRTFEDRDDVVIEVEDSGTGIKEEDIVKLFLPFSQVGEGKSGRHGGTGLGLMISQELARNMRGQISVKSVYGIGSVFSLRLPRHKVRAEQLS